MQHNKESFLFGSSHVNTYGEQNSWDLSARGANDSMARTKHPWSMPRCSRRTVLFSAHTGPGLGTRPITIIALLRLSYLSGRAGWQCPASGCPLARKRAGIGGGPASRRTHPQDRIHSLFPPFCVPWWIRRDFFGNRCEKGVSQKMCLSSLNLGGPQVPMGLTGGQEDCHNLGPCVYLKYFVVHAPRLKACVEHRGLRQDEHLAQCAHSFAWE